MSDQTKPKGPTPIEDAIRAAIDARGWTAYRVAKESGASKDAVIRFLKRERGLSLATAEELVVALGIVVTAPEPPAEVADTG